MNQIPKRYIIKQAERGDYLRKWLIEKRKSKGFAGTEVARQAGISQAEYSRIENGTRTPRPKVAKRIADMLGFDWIQFIEEERVG